MIEPTPEASFRKLVSDDEYPLLRQNPDLIARYNDLVQIFQDLRDESESLWKQLSNLSIQQALTSWQHLPAHRQAVEKRNCDILFRMQRVMELLRRERYRVGFVGRSAAGKSTTINETLGMTLLPEGRASACTSAVTRIFFISEGTPPSIEMHYMTQEEYRSRIYFFSSGINLDLFPDEEIAQKSEDELLEALKKKRPLLNGSLATMADSLAMILDTGLRLGKQWLGRPPEILSCRDTQHLADTILPLVKHLNPEQEGLARDRAACGDKAFLETLTLLIEGKPLLKDVTLSIPRASLSQTIELIDLPGLGSNSIEDDQITLNYIRTLDALMVFQTAETVDVADVTRLIDELRKNVGDPRGRVWMTITKIDAVGGSHVLYGDDGDSLFHSIDKMLRQEKLEADQVRFICNSIPLLKRKRLEEQTGNGLPVSPELDVLPLSERINLLKLRPDSSGDYVLPPPLKAAHSHFKAAFCKVFPDGGHAELRSILEARLAQTICVQVFTRIKSELKDIADVLSQIVDTARYRASDDLNQPEQASAWSTVVSAIGSKLEQEPGLMTDEFAKLCDALWQILDDQASVEDLQHQHSLELRHKSLSALLSRRCLYELIPHSRGKPNGAAEIGLEDGIILTVYKKVSTKLKELAGTKQVLKGIGSELIDPPGISPVNELIELGTRDVRELKRLSDLHGDSWEAWQTTESPIADAQLVDILRDCLSFQNTVLFKNTSRKSLSAEHFRQIMESKTEAVVYQLTHRLFNRLRTHSDVLHNRLALLSIPRQPGENLGNRERLNEFVEELMQFGTQLSALNYVPFELSMAHVKA